MSEGKEINYTLIFEKHGELKRISGDNHVWLDVGNSLENGFFDHHQNSEYKSAYSAVINNLVGLKDLKASVDGGEEAIIHLHEEPDLDCIASYYVVQYYLEHDEEETRNEFFNSVAVKTLEEYINDIDAGMNKNTAIPTLYAIFSNLDLDRQKSEETDRYIVEKGLELIEYALEALKKDKEINLSSHDCSKELAARGFDFNTQIKYIAEQAKIYEEEKEDGTIIFEDIPVWTKDKDGKRESIVKVPGAIWKRPSKSSNGYDYARKEGKTITVVPREIKGYENSTTTSVFTSINPDIKGYENYTLRPVAEVIEQMEQMEEQKLYEREGGYRRDHSRPRELTGHLGEMPFAATSDPWYVKPGGDLFDAPRNGSLLDYDDILGVLRNNGSAVRDTYVIDVEDNNKILLHPKENISISKWKQDVKKKINESQHHIVVWGELDASIITKNNRILEAYCMNLVGRSFSEVKPDNIRFLDYRTCVYTDLKCTIFLTAAYEGMKKEDKVLSDIMDLSDENSIMESAILNDISKLVKHRNDLLKYGKRIGELQPGDRKKVEGLNTDILSLSAQMQKDDMISNPVEREVYDFVKNEFDIAELKTSITEDIGIIVSETRDGFVSKFNILSSLAVPFVLIATLFQMGIIKIEAWLDVPEQGRTLGWIVTLAIIAIVVIWFLLWSKRKMKTGPKRKR